MVNMTERASLIQDTRRKIKLDAIEDQLEILAPLALLFHAVRTMISGRMFGTPLS